MELEETRFLERSPFWDELFLVLRKRASAIALVLLATVGGAYFALQFMTEKYQSDTSLLIKIGRENAQVPATVGNGGFLSTGVRREDLNSEVQMFRSRRLIEEVVDSLGADAFRFEPKPPQTIFQAVKYYAKRTYRWAKKQGQALLVWANLRKELTERENAILTIEESLSVEAEKESDVLTANLVMPDPKLSAEVLGMLVQRYVDMHVEVRKNGEVKEFFEEELAKLKVQLYEMDKEQERLLKQWDLADAAQQRALLLQRLSDTEALADANEAERAKLLQQRAAMDSRLEALPANYPREEVRIRNPSRETINQRITALRLEKEQLLSRYQRDSEPVKSVEEQLAGLEKLLESEATTHFDSATTEPHPVRRDFMQKREEVNVAIAGLEAQSAELEVLGGQLRRRLAAVNEGEDRLDEILRQRRVVEESYHAYSARMEDARISEALDAQRIANVSVVTPPTMPIEPIYPRKLLIMALSFPVGLVLGLGLALLLEYFNERIDSERDLTSIAGTDYLGRFDASSSSLSSASASGD